MIEYEMQVLKNQLVIMRYLFRNVSEGTELEGKMRESILNTERMIEDLEDAMSCGGIE